MKFKPLLKNHPAGVVCAKILEYLLHNPERSDILQTILLQIQLDSDPQSELVSQQLFLFGKVTLKQIETVSLSQT